jgi:hypothetical protein
MIELDINSVQNCNKNNNMDINIEKKTKEYILRAKRNYYNRNKDDIEYKQKIKEYRDKYRNNNKDEYNELQRNYMKAYRERKKVEKQNNQNQQVQSEIVTTTANITNKTIINIDNDINSKLENITITNKSYNE